MQPKTVPFQLSNYSSPSLRFSTILRRKQGSKMVVRIRLSRFGCKNKPFYRVMAADSRSPRDGKHLEVLGQDNAKRMGLNFERVKNLVTILTAPISLTFPKYWLSVGAQHSEPVERILFQAGILPPPPMVAMGRKGGPRDTHPVDALTGCLLNQEKPIKVDQNEDNGEDDGEDDTPTP